MDLQERFFADFTNPELGVRARMTWFFLNFFATPSSIVNDHLAMWKQYMAVFDNALGNYRSLSLIMFNDEALRKSLDQVGADSCCAAIS